MDAAVYIVTGFLESGKTKFMQEMLADEGFSEGERTLLLVCEEGEEEYDPELLRRTNTVMVTMESSSELSGDVLVKLDKQYRPERVLIEYNSTWMMETLYKAKKPKNWELAQIITLIDATTFELYLTNMRKFMADGIQEGDLIVFNRCTPDMPKSKWRRATLAMNNTARIFFENTDGTMDDGVADEDLPYDVKSDPIEIGDTEFGIFYLDAMEHPDRYDGKRIRAKGRAFRMEDMPKKCFVFGRHAMTCCVDDIGGIGFLCKHGAKAPDTNDWIYLTAKAEAGFSPLHGRDAIILIEESITPAEPPEEELVYFTN